MWTRIKRWFVPRKCALCGKKPNDPVPYFDDRNRPVVVCRLCSDYAERRAFRKRQG